MKISRKKFIKQSSLVTFAFISFTKLAASEWIKKDENIELINDSNGILNLPKGFSYKIISSHKDVMDDSLLVPNAADGMACFKGSKDNVVLVRNHELGHFPKLGSMFKKKNPFGKNFPSYLRKNKEKIYDTKRNKTECFGCTTTIVYDTKKQEIVKQYLSLAGTLINCSGGPTPWNTWISSEETVKGLKDNLGKNHGYNFEVKAAENINLNKAIPLKDMGRFRHEAVAVDPVNNLVYQTEDRGDGLFYRFVPTVMGEFNKGGKLQALSLKDFRGVDCSNWKQKIFKVGQKRIVKWIDLDNVDSPDDDLRVRGKNKGCASFTRGEGMWFADDYVYFTSTNGGEEKAGQIWRYKHIGKRGVEGELELFFESSSKDILKSPDNITVSPWGDLIVSEDGKGPDRLVGIKPDGTCYYIAKNIYNNSEFAGATFSPDGSVLFVNIYRPTMTIAITGPWNKFSKL